MTSRLFEVCVNHFAGVDGMIGRRFLTLTSLAMTLGTCLSLFGQTAKAAIDQSAIRASASIKVEVPSDQYILGPDDVLAINVWKEPEISRTLPVRPDGNISLPLLGDVPASGRTPEVLQEDIRQQLRSYLSTPEVTVLVQEAKSHKFNIVGEVEKPGLYVMSGPTTVLDAIALAGGLRDFAKQTKIYVLRVSKNGTRLRLPVNYKELIKGSNATADLTLQPRDTVVVP